MTLTRRLLKRGMLYLTTNWPYSSCYHEHYYQDHWYWCGYGHIPLSSFYFNYVILCICHYHHKHIYHHHHYLITDAKINMIMWISVVILGVCFYWMRFSLTWVLSSKKLWPQPGKISHQLIDVCFVCKASPLFV